jgi:hypothetical protein
VTSAKSGRAYWPRRAWVLGAVVVAGYLFVARAPLPLIQSWWLAGEAKWNDPWNRRHRMADWLVLSRSLIGKTRAQVVGDLGEPPPTDYFRDSSLVYNLGSERGFISIDSEWLVIRIGNDGRVVEARIVRD